MPNRVVLVLYGDDANHVADRVLTLARDCEAASVRILPRTTSLDVSSLRELVHDLAPDIAIFGVHVVSDGSEGEVKDTLCQLDQKFRDEYPGQQLEHWVVHDAGVRWDDDEQKWLAELVAEAPVQAAAIALRATGATAAHGPEEAWSFTGDLIHLLGVSDLHQSLLAGQASVPVVAVGIASVTYRRRLLARAAAAWHGVQMLEESLSEVKPTDVSVGLGRSFIDSLELLSDREDTLLRSKPDSQTIEAPLHLKDVEVVKAPLEQQPDLIRSLYDQMAMTRLRWAYDQVNLNACEREALIWPRIHKELLSQLSAHGSPERAKRWVAGALEALDEVETDLRSRDLPVPDPYAELEVLEDLIRKLPYPVAIGLRALGLGALGAALLSAPLVGLALAAGVGLGRWEWSFGRVRHSRNRAIEAAEGKLRALALQHVLDARIWIVQALKARLTSAVSPPANVTVDKAVLVELNGLGGAMKGALDSLAKYVDSRSGPSEGWTDYAILIPTVEDVPPDVLAKQAPLPLDAEMPAALWRRLFADSIAHTAEAVEETIFATLVPIIVEEGKLAPDLNTELKNRPSSAARAVKVLANDVVPAAAALPFRGATVAPLRSIVTPQDQELRATLARADGAGALDADRGLIEVNVNVRTEDGAFMARVCFSPLRSVDGELS